ncbi:MAG: hypothetical protein E7442_05650 [Ruminococcaceae bacterium]|nr:hypothetical protein [Oscillospiraceae bacterium]
MSELEDRLNAVLGDPAQMEKIAQMASKLMGSIAPEEKNASGMDPKLMGLVGRVAASLNGGGKTKLMAGLGPYLAATRRARLEKALRLGAAASLAVEFMGEMGGEKNEPL